MAKAFDSIRRGLEEAVYHGRGERKDVRIYRPEAVDVAALRHRMGMTQEQFAARFGFSVSALRHWERGDRMPRGPSLVLLNLIERAPETVLEVLS